MNEVVKKEENTSIDLRKKQKRELKKTVGHLAWGLILYTIIGIFISMIGTCIKMCVSYPNWFNMTDEEIDVLFFNFEKQEFFGMISCAIVMIGIAFLFLYFRKCIDYRKMFFVYKKMNSQVFIQLLCVFLGVQLLTEPIFLLLEKSFNFFGYSVMFSIEEATMGSPTLSMFLYAVVLGSVAEELVFRGFVLSAIKKYGKVYAILISAFLFGLIHANLPQSILAFMVGIILGYVAMVK